MNNAIRTNSTFGSSEAKILSLSYSNGAYNMTDSTAQNRMNVSDVRKSRTFHKPVEPIKDPEDIALAKEYFKNHYTRYASNTTWLRNYALFITGCNCARRIGDILSLTVGDFVSDVNTLTFNNYLEICEQKTGKFIKVKINSSIRDAISLYILDRRKSDIVTLEQYMFISREGSSPIGTKTAWQIMKDMSRAIGLEDKGVNIGTHSMRKTWGYNAIKKAPNNPMQICAIQKALNHSSPEVTLRYVGIDQDEMDNLFDSVEI